MQELKTNEKIYMKLLQQFVESGDEELLTKVKELSLTFVNRNVSPGQVVRMHADALQQIYGDEHDEMVQTFPFLTEALASYRLARVEFEREMDEEEELRSEIQVAANMQKTLLKTEIPTIEGLEIGAISVPFRQMNGDYYHFVKSDCGVLGVAIADVIGKGVPAALAMSMIKYAMDSFYEESMTPNDILRRLNRVVERNVTPNMFITMLYGQYFPSTSTFRFASAGHEPGFVYKANKKEFVELKAQGLVLGVLEDTKYSQYQVTIEHNDMIVLLTDGVTECRRGERFIKREELIDVIDQYAHLSAQQHVEQVYKHFSELEDFLLKDDFTLIVIKKEVC